MAAGCSVCKFLGTIRAQMSELGLAAYRVALLAVATLVATAVHAYAGEAHGAGSPTVRKTQVITFRPAVPTGPRRSGECWTDSAAVDRTEAWRCVADNEIYDPCFALAELKNAVVCGADPARKHPGFILELTKPLPARSLSPRVEPLPWMLQLADGSVCEFITGTSAQVGGQDVPYECSDARPCTDDRCPYLTGLTTRLHRGSVWRASKVAFSSSRRGTKLLKHTSVAVKAVWR